MTKSLLKTMLAAAMLATTATQTSAQTKVLREITSANDAEYYYYSYNEQNKVDSIFLSYPQNDMSFYRLYTYDAAGNQIQEDNYTDMYSDYYPEYAGQWIVTGRNIYGFDEYNRRISKKIYDLDFDSYDYALICSGAYGYVYDDQGRIFKETMYYDEEMTSETEIITYYYDEKGRLSNKDLIIAYYEDPYVEKRTTYAYDEQDRLLSVTISYADETATLVDYETISYAYDDKGNLISKKDVTTDFPDPMLEYKVTYNEDVLAKDVVFPYNYEDDTDFYSKSVNTVKGTEIYAIMDYDTGNAELYDNQTWVYEDLVPTGVGSVVSGDIVKDIILADGCLMVKGVSGRTDIRIYDMSGKPVFKGVTDGVVSVSSLPAGSYIVTSEGVSKKFTIR